MYLALNMTNINKKEIDFLISNEFYQSILSISLFISILIIFLKFFSYKNKSHSKNFNKNEILDLMGNTPIIYIKSLSKLTGYNIYAKCEYFSYYSSKDRIIKRILLSAKEQGKLKKETMIYENSTGLSGYSTACISHLLGYNSTIVLPDTCNKSLISQIKKTNCKLILTKDVDFSNFSNNYIRLCKQISEQDKNAFYLNLYQNELNYITHFEETANELYKQLNGKIDAFVCGADTGGTIAGLSNFLKNQNKNCFVALADIPGSGFDSYVKEGVLFRQERKEEKKEILTHIGKGNCFLNNNFRKAIINDSYICNYNEVMFIIDYLKENDEINIGFKEGINLVGILKMIKNNKNLPKNANIATIFLDNGLYDSEINSNYNKEMNDIKDINQIYK